MSITRLTIVNDSGGGIDGTIADSAWVTSLEDAIDAHWGQIAITSTGSVNNLSRTSSSVECEFLLCSNASDLTITGIVAPASPAKPGCVIVLKNKGSANVLLAHNSGSSTAANRLFNMATSANTPIGPGGFAVYTYNSTDTRWELTAHDSNWITPTFAAGDYTASGAGTWTVASGDRTTGAYRLVNKTLHFQFYLVTTTVARSGGDPVTLKINNGAWGGFTATKSTIRTCMVNDNATGNVLGYANPAAAGTFIGINMATNAQWANSTDQTAVYGEMSMEVT